MNILLGRKSYKKFYENLLFYWIEYNRFKKNKTLKIAFESKYFYKKGDILSNGHTDLRVLRTYPMNWWRRLLKKLGFKLKNEKYIKLKII